MDIFKSLKVFISVANLGSFTQAADALGMTKPAVSRAISELEHALKVQLLHRTTRSTSLTSEGALLLVPLREGIQSIEACMSEVRRSNSDLRGVIRIGAPSSVASAMLAPLVSDFVELHPDIEFDVQIDERHNELMADGIDVGLRIGTEPDSSWIVRPLGSIQMVQCASPTYVHRNGTPHTLDDLAKHRCIGTCHSRGTRAGTWEFLVEGAPVRHPISPTVTFNDVDVALHAARAGVGIAQLPNFLAQSELAAGRLVAVLSGYASDRKKVLLYYPRRAPIPTRVRRFIDFAVESLEGKLTTAVSTGSACLRRHRESVPA